MKDTVETLKRLPLFAGLPEDLMTDLAGKLARLSLSEGEMLFRNGDPGDAMFLIESGLVKVFLEDAQGNEVVLNECGPGVGLGEMSVVEQKPRTANVIALADTQLLSLSHNDLMDVFDKQPPEVMETLRKTADRLRLGYVDILRKLPLFENLSDEVIVELASKLETVDLDEGKTLFRKGDPGNSLYIIESGWVKIVTEGTGGEELVLNQCGPGQAIGEMSLVDQEPRSAGVVALSPVEMLKLRCDDFLDVLSEHPDLALDVMRNISDRLRFATTYIEKAIELSDRIAQGDYNFAIDRIQSEQSAIVDANLSDEARATELLSAFFAMVKGVQAREEKLKTQLRQLTIQIDEAKRKEEFESLTQSDFFQNLKASVQKMREEEG